MTIIKNAFVGSCKALGRVTSTAKESFMEGYRNPYKPQPVEDTPSDVIPDIDDEFIEQHVENIVEAKPTPWSEDSDLEAAR